MAKKQETLTPEERLQAALVPEGEQLYKVPENWCWTRMENIAQWGSGGTPSRKIPEYYKGDIPWIKTGELNDDYIFETEEHITQEAISHSSAKLFPANTVAIAMYGATIGKVGILGIAATTNQACACGVSNPSTNYKYLFYYTRSQKVNFINKGKGGAQPNISQEIIKSHEFPLPPLSEQQRIVDRIESLFAKLDEAKQKAQDALDSFETRKAAILHKAFTGELTAQWRKEHGVGMESWTSHPLKNVTQIGSGGTPSRKNSQYYLGNILWIKTGEIYWNCIYDSEEKITEEAIADSSAKIYPAGTVLVAMYGQGLTRGRAAILGVPATTNQAVCALQPCDCLEKRYLYYYFMANYWEYREKAVGGNQPNYSATMIGKWIINIPSVLEQAEIVRILDNLLAKEQQAKEAAEGVLEQIDLIKKAILARAFRGELGTNDPSEESAVELLKRVIERGEQV